MPITQRVVVSAAPYLAAAALFAFSATGAAAAPQALAVAQTDIPVPLTCTDGICQAEFTSICLQERRASPRRGTVYRAVDSGPLRLVATLANGETVELPAGDSLEITALRSHIAVRMSLPQDVLRAVGAVEMAVAVGENLTILPESRIDDANPQSAQEIELAAGPLRQVAARVLRTAGARMDAAKVANRMINLLPPHGRAAQAERSTVWRRGQLPGMSDAGQSMARQAYDRCLALTEYGSDTLRSCLGSYHDTFVGKLNVRYWNALKTGS